MGAVSPQVSSASVEISRRDFRLTEGYFGSILTDIAVLLYPKPNTAAQIAAVLGCSVRNVELCLSGKQKWSGDAVAVFVAEICRRHSMRNLKIVKRG